MARAAQYQGSISSDVVARGTEILALDGELDVSNAGDFERRLPEASGPEPTDILLDLRGVSCLAAFPPSPLSAASALAAAQHAYVGAAVTEITTLRADLLDPQLG